MKKTNKIIWFISFILLIVAIIILFLVINRNFAVDIFFLSPLLVFIILVTATYFFTLKKEKSFLIKSGTICGGIWGALSFFGGVWFMEKSIPPTFLLFLITYKMSKYFKLTVGSPIRNIFLTIIPIAMGFLMGALIGFIISKIKRKNGK